MSDAPSRFELIVERLGEPEPLAEPLRLPAHVGHLTVNESGPILVEESGPFTWLLEPVSGADGGEYLLMLPPADRATGVNGHASPAVAVLDVRDQVQIDDYVLHVTQFHTLRVCTPPPEEFLTRECPLCRVPFHRGSRVYICPYCRAVALHADSHEEAEGPLDCVAISSECAGCQKPIVREAGYSYWPEFA